MYALVDKAKASHKSTQSIVPHKPAPEDGQLRVQRGGSGDLADTTAKLIVHEVLRSPGRPLDPATRAFFEPRFGHDFSRVRIHDDERAAASARAVSASAYSVGGDVVFGAAQFAPHTTEGRKLLAHELTHVVQQGHFGRDAKRIRMDPPARGAIHAPETTVTSNRAAPTERAVDLTHAPSHFVQRQPEVKVDPGATCNLDQHRKIEAAAYKANEWLTRSIPAIDAALSGPWTNRPVAATWAAAALGKHFHSSDPAVVGYVKTRLETIKGDLFGRQNFHVNCPPASDQECALGTTGEELVARVPNCHEVDFCHPFFGRSVEDCASTIIHEFAHALFCLPTKRDVIDRAYQSDRYYPYLTTAEALTNAESYAMLVREIATGSSPAPEAVSDDIGDSCPPDWDAMVADAMTKARMWNHRAALSPTAPREFIRAYAAMDGILASGIGFKCILDGGGRCPTSALYWYIAGDLRICPSWRHISSPDDRALTMLRALYGYKGLLDGDDKQGRAALEARRLHSAYVPSTAEVLSGN